MSKTYQYWIGYNTRTKTVQNYLGDKELCEAFVEHRQEYGEGVFIKHSVMANSLEEAKKIVKAKYTTDDKKV